LVGAGHVTIPTLVMVYVGVCVCVQLLSHNNINGVCLSVAVAGDPGSGDDAHQTHLSQQRQQHR